MTVNLNRISSLISFDGESCSICLESFPEGSAIGHSFDSGYHAFHENCIKHQIALRPSCPCCRAEFANVLEWIPQEAIDRAQGLELITHVENKDLEQVTELLAKGQITSHYRGVATIQACVDQSEDLIAALLNRSISCEHRGKAFLEAIEQGTLAIAQALYDDGDLTEESIENAYLWASSSNDDEPIAFLLERLPLNQRLRGLCAIQACDCNNFQRVQKLLLDKKISRPHRGQALVTASIYGNIKITEFLCFHGEILSTHLKEAFFEAVTWKHNDIIMFFISNHLEAIRPFLKEAIDLAKELDFWVIIPHLEKFVS